MTNKHMQNSVVQHVHKKVCSHRFWSQGLLLAPVGKAERMENKCGDLVKHLTTV